MKRAYRYRFYPADAQALEPSRTFGCVRPVHNNALAARTQAWCQRQERVNCNATSTMLRGRKKTDDLAFLTEVSSVPLQQTLRHLQGAFSIGSSPPPSGVRPLGVGMCAPGSCERCGMTHDRDANAAIDLKSAGPAVFACGAGARPQRESSRTGLSVTKQEGHGATRDGAKVPNHR